MGRDAADAFPPDDDERPRRVVTLDAFRISRVPVTNRRFHGEGDDRPVTYVSRAEAEAFCAREGVRLPTEEEWEAAARGSDDRLWPWGDELPDRARATFAAGIGAPSEAGMHPAGASACGALDMAGNVWEWTSGDAVRGGSYLSGPNELRCSYRFPVAPGGARPVRRLPRRRRRSLGGLRLGRRPGGRLPDRARPGERARRRRRRRLRARPDAGHERRSTRASSRTAAPGGRRTGLRPTTIP